MSFRRHLLAIAAVFALGGLFTLAYLWFVPEPPTWRGLVATLTGGGVAAVVLMPDFEKLEIATWKWRMLRGMVAGSIGGFAWWLVMGATGAPGWPIVMGAVMGGVALALDR